MNHITASAGALTKLTTCNSRQTKQTATNQQHATEQDTANKQAAERAHRDAHSKTPHQKQIAQHAHTATRHAQSQTRTDKHTRSPSEQHRARIQGNPATAPNRHSHGVSRHRLRPSATTHGNHTIPKQGIARSRPARSNTGSGQTVDKREIPGYPQREHPPTRRDNHANTVQTRKREKPTPHPPEQRRGKPQQAGAWTPADSRGIEPHPNNSSEPISSRTLHLAGLLSK